MTFILLMIVLLLQRLVHLGPFAESWSLFPKYYQFVKKYSQQQSWWFGWWQLVVVLPIVLLFALLQSLFVGAWGVFGQYMICLLLLWMILDVRQADKILSADDIKTSFLHIQEYGFTLVFWFFFLGPYGALIYYLLLQMRQITTAEDNHFLHARLNQGILWINWPAQQLMGLSFAVVGHFAPTFDVWYKQLGKGVAAKNASTAALRWACVALNIDHSLTTLVPKDVVALRRLLNRALMCWLFVLAVASIASWS